jgi:hypothetical protein
MMIVTYRPQPPQTFKLFFIAVLAVGGLTLIGFAYKNPFAVKVVKTVQSVQSHIVVASQR